MEPVKTKSRIKRRFLGKLNGFTDSVDRNFNKKMLKAYLRGDTHFSFGLDEQKHTPIMYKVLQELYKPKKLHTNE